MSMRGCLYVYMKGLMSCFHKYSCIMKSEYMNVFNLFSVCVYIPAVSNKSNSSTKNKVSLESDIL